MAIHGLFLGNIDILVDMDSKHSPPTPAEEDQSSKAKVAGVRKIPHSDTPGNLYKMRRWLSSSRHPTKSACEACRQAKTKCQETRPCKRCMSRGMECRTLSPILQPSIFTDVPHDPLFSPLAGPVWKPSEQASNELHPRSPQPSLPVEVVDDRCESPAAQWRRNFDSTLMDEALLHVSSR